MECVLSCCLSETIIGIIIGSCFTLAGVIANGVITYFLNRNTHSLEVEERKRCEQKKELDEKREKRERVYREFVSFYSFMNLFVGLAYAMKDNPVNANIIGSLYQEKIKENFSKVADTISNVWLYGSSAIAKMCLEYQDFWNAESQKGFPVEDFVKLDQEFAKIVNAMKKELELDNL